MEDIQKEYQIVYTGRNVLTFKGIFCTPGGYEADGKTQRKIYSDKVFMPGLNIVTEIELACLQMHPNFMPCFGDQGVHQITRVSAGKDETGKEVFTNVVKLTKNEDLTTNGAFFQWGYEGRPDAHIAKPFHKTNKDEAVERIAQTFSVPLLKKLKEIEMGSQNRKDIIGKIDDQIDLLESPAKIQAEKKK